MAIYRYQHGDRPLDGFTIQHGLGRGGFGEVYYALSDAGREVALKAVQNYEDIELRGIKHCMNLKHPQLVSIFDIKHSDDDLPFVVMEYIDGPSLRDILDSHPDGLGPAKAAFFLQEIVKGLAYLHDCGVVHRDLKPHNVFYENGVVKIGDYSLSKAISTSHRSGHTVTVGTVHYMAPEVSLGHYDHTVDIYALGVLLYEMLKGHPPFLGSTMGEVLMKHVAGNVDVSSIEEPFRHVIQKALAKEPHERYQSAQTMIDDLLGSAGLQASVASLGPETLTVIADQAMRVAKERQSSQQTGPSGTAATTPPNNYQKRPEEFSPAAFVAAKAEQARKHPWVAQGIEKANEAKHYVATATASIQEGKPIGIFGAAGRVAVTMVFILTMIGGVVACEDTPIPLIIIASFWFCVYKVRRKMYPRQQSHSTPPPLHTHQTAHTAQQKPTYAASYATAGHGRNPSPSPNGASAAQPDPVYDAQPVIMESPYSRFVALVMSTFGFLVPVMGLQRFYVGRVKTGLLWLFTFGLFGFGQIYDTILIALGQFKDADGNRVLNFTRERVADRLAAMKEPVNEYSNVVRRQWTESRVGFKLGNLVANFFGAVFLIVALAAGTITALDVPAGIAAGAFGSEAQRELAREFHMSDWNIFITGALGIITLIAGMIAAICLIFARRESTWGHMLRIPIATVGFVSAVMSVGSTTGFGSKWYWIAEQVQMERWGEAFRVFMREFWPSAIGGSLCLIIAVFVLAWPAKRKQIEPAQSAPKGVTAEQNIPEEAKQTV